MGKRGPYEHHMAASAAMVCVGAVVTRTVMALRPSYEVITVGADKGAVQTRAAEEPEGDAVAGHDTAAIEAALLPRVRAHAAERGGTCDAVPARDVIAHVV